MRVLVIVGMFMSVVVFVKMIVLMRMVVRMIVPVVVGVRVDLARAVRMLVRMFMRVGMLVGVGATVSREHVFTGANSFTRVNIDLGAGEAAAHDLAGFEPRADVEGFGDGGEFFEGDAGVDEGAEEHVAADAGEAVKIRNTHAL